MYSNEFTKRGTLYDIAVFPYQKQYGLVRPHMQGAGIPFPGADRTQMVAGLGSQTG